MWCRYQLGYLPISIGQFGFWVSDLNQNSAFCVRKDNCLRQKFQVIPEEIRWIFGIWDKNKNALWDLATFIWQEFFYILMSQMLCTLLSWLSNNFDIFGMWIELFMRGAFQGWFDLNNFLQFFLRIDFDLFAFHSTSCKLKKNKRLA